MLYIDDAVIGIRTPTDYRHIKLLRLILCIISFWPYKEMGENEGRFPKLLAVYTIIMKASCLVSNVAYLLIYRDELKFQEIGHVYITMFITTLALTRTMILPLNPKYRTIMARFIHELHLFHHKDTSKYAYDMHVRVHYLSHMYSIYLFILMITGLTLFNVVPLISNISSGTLKKAQLYNETYKLSVYYALPRDATTNRNSYIFLSIFNFYTSYTCSSIVFMIDLILSILVFHVWGHFKILVNSLHTFMRPKSESNTGNVTNAHMFSEEELEQVSTTLKKCVDYHRFIVNFTNAMSDTFGPILFLYYIFHQVCCCLLLLKCSAMTTAALMSFGPLTFGIFQQLIQLSVVFELIGAASEQLRDEVYGLPWECMDTSNRKTVMIFLMNTQKEIHVKAMGVAEVGVKSMAAILRTSISYFAFLRTIAD